MTLSSLSRSRFTRIALTIALPLQALLVNEWFRDVLAPMFEPAFIAAVALVCWFCGSRYAAAALGLSSLLLVHFFLEPYYSFSINTTGTVVKLIFFFGANAITTGLIANLRRTQEDLVTTENIHRNLSELIPFGGWISDASGNMLSVSDSFLNAFGARAEDCKGLGWTRFLDPEQRDTVITEWQECMQAGYFWDYEYQMRTAAGEKRVVLSRGVPVRDASGRINAWVGMHLDITERHESLDERVRQARDIARFNAELEQLAYASAHDLQEPLRMIASYLQLLKRRYAGRLDSDADEFIAYAVEGADRLRSLLHDLLQLQQIGKGTRERAMHSVADIVQNALHNLGSDASVATVRCGPLPEVCCDRTEFVQLFENLIDNALKYARHNVPPEITITAERQSDTWVIAVADNGIGVEPQYQHKIFDLFQRLHARSEYEGTGIGLAICRKVVEVHGGRIWIESQPGVGSTFLFTVPDAA
jgi:PAS domain S-box-containing protein